jgi:hypothetical protein
LRSWQFASLLQPMGCRCLEVVLGASCSGKPATRAKRWCQVERAGLCSTRTRSNQLIQRCSVSRSMDLEGIVLSRLIRSYRSLEMAETTCTSRTRYTPSPTYQTLHHKDVGAKSLVTCSREFQFGSLPSFPSTTSRIPSRQASGGSYSSRRRSSVSHLDVKLNDYVTNATQL